MTKLQVVNSIKTSSRSLSWGRLFRGEQNLIPVHWRDELLEIISKKTSASYLAHGLGRSYGDVPLNSGGFLLDSRSLDRILSFDPHTGVLNCEAGLSIEELLKFGVPRGWFPPVTPGTRFVTIGGAIANDVHGKNHHCAGTFGHHIQSLDLLRSDGTVYHCSRTQNSELFRATIGGLGLTGIILSSEIQLKKIFGPFIDSEIVPISGLDEFFVRTTESDRDFEYTVCWIDCLARGTHLGRGLYIRGNHSSRPSDDFKFSRRFGLPVDLPSWCLNPSTGAAFNSMFFHKGKWTAGKKQTLFEPFFYPLDAISSWNRAYGKSGFYQYQFVLPLDRKEKMREILELISLERQGSFLSVLKVFGSRVSEGMLSFPMEGITLALDFPNRGAKTLELFDRLDRRVIENGGRVYPAKDSRMSAETFEKSFPQWREFLKYRDPQFNSNFWERVNRTSKEVL